LLSSEPKWALRVLKKIIEDVRDGVIDSRNLNRSSDIENYFKSFPKNLQKDESVNINPTPFKEINLKQRKAAPKTTQKSHQKSKAVPRPRVTLAPRKHNFMLPATTKAQNLLREASSLDAGKFTISAAFVLRSFVELTVNEYLDSNNINKTKSSSNGNPIEVDLSKKLELVVSDIVSKDQSKNPELNGFRKQIMNKKSLVSIQSLNDFVHNRFQIPTADALRVGWDSCVPVFIATYGSV